MQPKPVSHSVFHVTCVSTLALLFTALFFLSACSTPSQPPATEAGAVGSMAGSSGMAYKEGVPGGVVVDTVEVSAKITAIDAAHRKVTLLGPDGKKSTVKVGPEAVNFDQLRVGDHVNATLTKELVVFLGEEGATAPDGSAAMVALAPKGAQPGGVVAQTTQVTATVKAIDPANRTATLQFEDGSAETFPVRDDIDLSKRKVGEKVVFQFTEMIAIDVEKQ